MLRKSYHSSLSWSVSVDESQVWQRTVKYFGWTYTTAATNGKISAEIDFGDLFTAAVIPFMAAEALNHKGPFFIWFPALTIEWNGLLLKACLFFSLFTVDPGNRFIFPPQKQKARCLLILSLTVELCLWIISKAKTGCSGYSKISHSHFPQLVAVFEALTQQKKNAVCNMDESCS